MSNAEHLMTLTKLGHRDENERRTRPASQQMPVNKYTKFFPKFYYLADRNSPFVFIQLSILYHVQTPAER